MVHVRHAESNPRNCMSEKKAGAYLVESRVIWPRKRPLTDIPKVRIHYRFDK